MEKLYDLLYTAQASLFQLFQKTWVYHWNVVGSDFYQLHTVFGDQYETMFEEIDKLTEHMRYLRMKAPAQLSRVLDLSEIAEADPTPTDKVMISQLMNDNKKIIAMMTNVSEEADKQKQYATSNLVQEIMETHGKFVWMLRSFLKE
jgi:starvation-inducible DNA-binding protein